MAGNREDQTWTRLALPIRAGSGTLASMRSVPTGGQVVSVRDGALVPVSGLIEQGVLVPAEPDLESPRVTGIALRHEVRVLGLLHPPFIAPRETGAAPPPADEAWVLATARRFVGVPVSIAVANLAREGRCLPLEVWLRVADCFLDAQTSLDPEHLVWRHWVGPHCIGASIEGQLVVSAGPAGMPFLLAWRDSSPALSSDWGGDSRLQLTGHARLAERARQALVWMLAPWKLGFESGSHPWDGTFSHPQLTAGLARVLTTRPGPDTFESVRELREALRGCWKEVEPMSERDACAAIAGASPQTLLREVSACEAQPEALPPPWRGGALSVRGDELLADALPVTRFPPVARATSVVLGVSVSPTRWLRARVLVDDACVAELQLESGANRRALPLPPKPLPLGRKVAVSIEHPKQDALAVRVPGRVTPAAIELEQPVGAERHALEAIFELLRPPPPDAPRRTSVPPHHVAGPTKEELIALGRERERELERERNWVQTGPEDWEYVGPVTWARRLSGWLLLLSLPLLLVWVVVLGVYLAIAWSVRAVRRLVG